MKSGMDAKVLDAKVQKIARKIGIDVKTQGFYNCLQ